MYFTVLLIFLGTLSTLGNAQKKEVVIGKASFDVTSCSKTVTFSDLGDEIVHDVGLCKENSVFRSVHCSGRYCDNVQIECCDVKLYGNKTAKINKDTCRWGPWRERDGPLLDGGDRSFITGMQCSGGYCDKMRSYYCDYDFVKFGPVLESTFETSDESKRFVGCESGTSSLKSYRYTGKHSDKWIGQCFEMSDFSPCPIGTNGQGCQNCGNDVVEGLEDCDSKDPGCISCKWASCGDGIISTGIVQGLPYKEECDDIENNGADRDCTPTCMKNVCGDGFLHKKEECEVGNSCDSSCVLRPHDFNVNILSAQEVNLTWSIQKDNFQHIDQFKIDVLYADTLEKVNIAQQQLAVEPHKFDQLITNLPAGRSIIFRIQAMINKMRLPKEERWSSADVIIMPCGCGGLNGDQNDQPSDLQVSFSLSSLSICPQWKDNSFCEYKFFLLRKAESLDTEISKIGSVNGQKACGSHIANTRECENLLTEKYDVGETVKYCVEQEISRDITIGNTEKICSDFIVPWVATIKINHILNGTEAKIIPVNEYKVDIYVGDRLFSRNDVVSTTGSAAFNVQLPNSTSEFESVYVVITKQTDNIQHVIQCIDDFGKNIPCEEHKISVGHLSTVEFFAKDFSARSVEGQLTYDGTEKYTGSEACGVFEEMVCAKEILTNDLVCVKTDQFGFYRFLLPIGLDYELYVQSSFEHKYVTANDKQEQKHKIKLSKSIKNLDFLNVENRQLTVEYFGGECMNSLEGASFKFNPVGSCEFRDDNRIVVESQKTFKTLAVPAIPLTITYEENVGKGLDKTYQNDINNHFSDTNNNRVVNLTTTNVDDHKAVFRYDSKVEISLIMNGDVNKCSNLDNEVLIQGEMYNLTFFLYQKYPHGKTCTKFSNTTELKFIDKVGENGGICRDNLAIPNSNGCAPTFSRESPATAKVSIQAGVPNLFTPHLKELLLEVTVENRSPNTESTAFQYVVMGERSDGLDSLILGMPQWMPILILRRPPGGTSFSQLTSESSFQTEMGLHFKSNYKLGASFPVVGFGLPTLPTVETSVESESSNLACVGVSCLAVQSKKSKTELKVGIDLSGLRSRNLGLSSSKSKTITIKTSDSPRMNSVKSDLFVLPNMLIKLQELAALTVTKNLTNTKDDDPDNDDICDIHLHKKVAWTTQPKPGSADTLSFMSEFEVDTEIKKLKRILEDFKKLDQDEFDEDLNGTIAYALEGWKSMIDLNFKLKQEAYKNPSKLNIFEGSNKYETPEDIKSELNDANTIRFFGGGQSFSRTTSSVATKKATFQYGFKYEYALGRARYKDMLNGNKKTSILNRRDLATNLDIHDPQMLEEEFYSPELRKLRRERRELPYTLEHATNQFAIGLLDSFAKGGSFQATIGSGSTSTEAVKTSFALSDPNLGDEFTVEVYTDPVYGTPVFKTVAGMSRCMYEQNTTMRENIGLRFAKGQKQEIRNIRQGQSGYVSIEVVNEHQDGEYIDSRITVDPLSNQNGLRVFLNGAYLTQEDGITLNIFPGVTVLTLSFEQGQGFEFNDVEILVRSSCEPWRETLTRRLKFSASYLEECAGFDWAGVLKSDKTFLVTQKERYVGVPVHEVPIMLQRMPSTKPFSEQQRLKNVQFQYRRLGDEIWETPEISEEQKEMQHRNLFFDLEKNITLEDEYGFSLMYWDTRKLIGGSYEIRVRASCSRDTGIDDLDNAYSEIIVGNIDRLQPTVFTKPTPIEEYNLGDSFTIKFDEPIDCSRPLTYSAILSFDDVDERYEYNSQAHQRGLNELATFCFDNTIEVSLTAAMNFEIVSEKRGTMTVCNVRDAHGNKVDGCISWSFKFAKIDLRNAIASSTIIIDENVQSTVRRRDLTFNDDFNQSGIANVTNTLDMEKRKETKSNANKRVECLGPSNLLEELKEEIAEISETSIANVDISCVKELGVQKVIDFKLHSDVYMSGASSLNRLSANLAKRHREKLNGKATVSSSFILDNTINSGEMPVEFENFVNGNSGEKESVTSDSMTTNEVLLLVLSACGCVFISTLAIGFTFYKFKRQNDQHRRNPIPDDLDTFLT